MLSHFQLAKFTFLLKAQELINLPVYKGSTFRGAFGHTFRKIVCVLKKDDCSQCLLKEKCIYSYVFETPVPKNSEKMKKYPQSPHPFVIEPPLEDKRLYQKGDPICFNLTLIGKSIDYLPYFIYTFIELGKRGIGKGNGRYLLEEVRDLNGKVIFSSEDNTLKNGYSILQFDDITSQNNSGKISLSFLTPTRIKFDERLTLDLEFHVLIRNLLRRISLLSYFHCGEELNLNFREVIEMAKEVQTLSKNLRWHDWERYSNRQKTRMNMGGFMGEIAYEGDLDQFHLFLKLGEYIHLGKGSSFGLGKYEIKLGDVSL